LEAAVVKAVATPTAAAGGGAPAPAPAAAAGGGEGAAVAAVALVAHVDIFIRRVWVVMAEEGGREGVTEEWMAGLMMTKKEEGSETCAGNSCILSESGHCGRSRGGGLSGRGATPSGGEHLPLLKGALGWIK